MASFADQSERRRRQGDPAPTSCNRRNVGLRTPNRKRPPARTAAELDAERAQLARSAGVNLSPPCWRHQVWVTNAPLHDAWGGVVLLDAVRIRAMSDDKTKKPAAEKPRGFRDRLGAELQAERRMLETIRAVYDSYGFDPLETPAIEFADALGKFLPDQDRPNEGVFAFRDDDEAMALAALRSDRAARPLRRRKLRRAAQTLPPLSSRPSLPQRKARPRPLSRVHAVRRRHGRHGVACSPTPKLCMMTLRPLRAPWASAATTSSKSTTAKS